LTSTDGPITRIWSLPEVATLLGFLDHQRATLAWKCSGPDAAGLRATVASTMTLGGILKHMALVEDGWFSRSLHGREYAPPWDAVDWEADRDWEWHTAAEDSGVDQRNGQWRYGTENGRHEVGRLRTVVRGHARSITFPQFTSMTRIVCQPR
jgi:hypothetical protein